MKKLKIAPLFLILAMFTGCAEIKTNRERYYIRICRKYLEENVSATIITHWKNTDVTFSPLPENYSEISSDFIPSKEYCKVTFQPECYASLTFKVNFYLDESGTIIGIEDELQGDIPTGTAF